MDCDDEECMAFAHCQPIELLENTQDYCTDNLDNDEDTLVDCDDPDCQGFMHCNPPELTENTMTLCSDNIDNDEDTKIDCDDEECAGFSFCADPTENTLSLCSDGIDNDEDTFVDCDDDECQAFTHCQPIELTENTNVECSDGEDNDDDGMIDCDDDSCSEVLACLPNITVTPLSTAAPDTSFIAAASAVMSGVNWYVGNAGSDSQISGPSATLSAGWGGIYAATGTTGETREMIDLSEYFYNKLKFRVRTNCEENYLDFKSQWKSPDPADQVGLAYNYTVKVNELIPDDQDWDVGDNQWHEYEVDFARTVKMSFQNSKELVLPFSLWCTGNASGKSIEVEDIRFEGVADINCIEITGVPDLENNIYCDLEE